TCAEDTEFHLWDADTGKQLRTHIGEGLKVRSAAFSPDGKTLALGCLDQTVRLVNLDTEQEIRKVEGKFGVYSPDGKAVATTRDNPDRVQFWDAATGRLVEEFDAGGWVFYVPFSPDGRFLAAPAAESVPVRLWEVAQPAARPRTFRLGPSFGFLPTVAFTP